MENKNRKFIKKVFDYPTEILGKYKSSRAYLRASKR
jgi:hypothetical protein